MFTRYVSFGNSIPAGFKGFGLSDSLQRLAYPVLLARAMGSPFYYPSLTNPGCPPPITFIFSSPPTRLNNLPATFCALRSSNVPPFLNNVAFPGADILAVLNTNYGDPQPPASATDVYKLFLFGATGVHPDAHGPPELSGFTRHPAGRHRTGPGPIPFRRAARGAGRRWNTDHARLLRHPRDLGAGGRQPAWDGRSVQCDHRPGGNRPGVGVRRPQPGAPSPGGGPGGDPTVPGVPPRPQRDRRAIRHRGESGWGASQHVDSTVARPDAARLDQRALQRSDPADPLSANPTRVAG